MRGGVKRYLATTDGDASRAMTSRQLPSVCFGRYELLLPTLTPRQRAETSQTRREQHNGRRHRHTVLICGSMAPPWRSTAAD